MTSIVRIKQGSHFVYDCAVQDNGAPVDMTLWSVASQIRDGETLIADLTLTWVDRAQGKFRLSFTATASWPRKKLEWDIKYTTNTGQITHTDTILVMVFDSETA